MSTYSSLLQQQVTHSAPQDLDFLVNDLRFPPEGMTVQRVLGYILHYLPYVKQEQNLRILLSAFLNNPTCFGQVHNGIRPAEFDEIYLIIEVWKMIADTKLKVSQPSISIKTWYAVVGKELQNFVDFDPPANGWKVLPIIAGLTLSNDLRDNLYTRRNYISYGWFFSDWDSKMTQLFKNALLCGSMSDIYPKDITNLSLMSLGIFHDVNQNILSFTSGLTSERFVVHRLVDMLVSIEDKIRHTFFGPGVADTSVIFNDPIVKHINKISLLLESFLKRLPITAGGRTTDVHYEFVSYTVGRLMEFNRNVNHLAQSSFKYNYPSKGSVSIPAIDNFWHVMKSVLFGQVLIFQGILTGFVEDRNSIISLYKEISLKVLHNLYYLNFILLSIGQGGFDSYNFVYYLAIEVAMDGGALDPFERLTSRLVGDYRELNLYNVHEDYIMRSKVLFVMGLWENYLNQLQGRNIAKFAHEQISPVCFSLAQNEHGVGVNFDVIESAHSVLLSIFARNKKDMNTNEIMQYVELIFGQFPLLLSANQLSIAVETIGKFTLTNISRPKLRGSENQMNVEAGYEFLNYLFDQCLHARPGMFIGKNGQFNTISTAQPIAKYEANSTMLHIEDDQSSSQMIDIIDLNKKKKPKDLYFGPQWDKKKKDKQRQQQQQNQEQFQQQQLDEVQLEEQQNDEKQEQQHNSYEFQEKLSPDTVREALVFSFLNLIPYLPLSIFTFWLDKMWILIEASDPSEKKFLTKIMWRVISENLDLNRCELGYEWWYELKRIPEKL